MNALSDLRVLDLSTGRPGAVAAMFLADFGADVVRRDAGEPFVFQRGKRIGDLSDADVVITETPVDTSPETIVLHVPASLDPDVPLDSEGLVDAWMGISLRQFSFDGGPIDHVVPITELLHGVWAATCSVAALIEREGSGLGQTVTVSGEHGAMISIAGGLTFRHADLGAVRPRGGDPGGSVPFYRTFRCADGEWLFFGALIPNFTRIGFEVLGLSDLFDDPRLEGRGRAAMLAPENAPWVTATIAERFAQAPRDEWLEKLRAAGCPAGAVLTRETWMDHPQVDAVGMRAEADGAVLPGVSLKFGGAIEGERIPIEGGNGPLTGVRVLDLGAIIAGPFSASLLGELGADVIKVEPLTGDSFRGPGFHAYNKGQRSIALDLRHDDGRAVFNDLVRTADIVIDNYRPGVVQRLGIDHASLRQTNPSIISASITGFGEGGPYGNDAGFDPILQAMSGMMRAQGGTSDPVFYSVPVNDVAASAVIAFGCTLALFDRVRAGRVHKLSTSLAAMSVFLQSEALARYEGRPPPRLGSRDHAGPSPLDRFYRANDGWVRVRTRDVEPLGIEPTAAAIATWVASRSQDDAVAEFRAAGIDAVPARTIADIAADERSYIHEILHRDPHRDASTAGRHARFSRTMRNDVLVSPSLGQHTRELLTKLAYDDAQIDALLASGGVG